jgi:putative FmdB family regulatory protein
MALYGFKCEECEKEFEVNCKIVDRDNPQECEDCGSKNTKRSLMIGAVVYSNRMFRAITKSDTPTEKPSAVAVKKHSRYSQPTKV